MNRINHPSDSVTLSNRLGTVITAAVITFASMSGVNAQQESGSASQFKMPAKTVEQLEQNQDLKDDETEAIKPSDIQEQSDSPQGSDKLPAVQQDQLPAVQKDKLPAVQKPGMPEPQLPQAESQQPNGGLAGDSGLPEGATPAAGSMLHINGAIGIAEITRGEDGATATWSIPSSVIGSHVRLEVQSSDFTTDCYTSGGGLPGTGRHLRTTSSVDLPVDNPAYTSLDTFYVRGCIVLMNSADSYSATGDVTNTVQVNINEPMMTGDGDGGPGDGGDDDGFGFVPRKPETDLGDRTPDELKQPREILEEQHKEEAEVAGRPAQEVETVVKDKYILEPSQKRAEKASKRKNFSAAIGARCWPNRRYADGEIMSVGEQKEPLWDSGSLLVVGYDYYNYWEPRKRCELGNSITYKSMVKFDLSDLPRDREIKSAELTFVHGDENRIGDAHRKTVAQRIRHTKFCGGSKGDHRTMVGEAIAGIGLPLADWTPGHEYVSSHTPTNIIFGLSPGSSQSVDITPIVKSWLEGSPNRGIAFLGRRYDYPQTNKVCIAFVGDLKLEVEY